MYLYLKELNKSFLLLIKGKKENFWGLCQTRKYQYQPSSQTPPKPLTPRPRALKTLENWEGSTVGGFQSINVRYQCDVYIWECTIRLSKALAQSTVRISPTAFKDRQNGRSQWRRTAGLCRFQNHDPEP